MMLSLGGCTHPPAAGQAEQPPWVLGESAQYPRKQYLLGVGEGDTQQDAKSRARAEIATHFQVSIEATSVDKSSFLGTQKQGQDDRGSTQITLSQTQSIASELRTSTKQMLQGVEIAEVWQDQRSQRYYALATLSRLKTALVLRTNIEALDSAIAGQLDHAQSLSSVFRKIRASSKAIRLLSQRQALNQQLQVVSLVGQGIVAQWSLERLKIDHLKLLNRVNFRVVAEGLHAEAIERSLSDVLAGLGYQVTEQGDYLISATLSATPLPKREGWYYQTGTLSISISGDYKRSLGGHNWHFKVSATEQSLSQLRVLEEARRLLSESLNDQLLEILSVND